MVCDGVTHSTGGCSKASHPRSAHPCAFLGCAAKQILDITHLFETTGAHPSLSPHTGSHPPGRFLAAAVAAAFIPQHMRTAATQLLRDLGSDGVVHDVAFVLRHLRAFAPRSISGWFAASSVLGFLLSAACMACCAALGISGMFSSTANLCAAGFACLHT